MSPTVSIVAFLSCLWVALASSLNETDLRASCTVTSYSKVADAVSSCTDITIDGITIPASTTLEMKLKDGATVTFKGQNKFDYATWDGPLLKITGKGITVKGASGHSLDGQGSKYWDGKGGSGGKTKPKFFRIQATGGSVFEDLNIKNCPKQCVSIGDSDSLTISNFNIDCSAGDSEGKNTDGFDVSSSSNIVIKNSVVKNQDDCVAVNHGSDMKFTGLTCSGGHGLSLSVGQSKTDSSANTVSNIEFSDCTVTNSRNGIHIKTHSDAASGSVKSVTYSNIKMSGITYYAINVQEDYENGSSSGTPKGNIPITGLTIKGITATMTGSHSVPVYILCGTGGCSSWSWSSISISGNEKSSSCNYTPSGYSC
ncbi:hypothetical protein NQ318_012729 [Aromia moschata]|uniref:endo-polygalacturonase n=1 Tax=Aromia moschata TaxID=1265417 RepID=A0AAV8XRW7_9CUCU|nr:hypothetical protein NQ318_012729 [Aromia moschata]